MRDPATLAEAVALYRVGTFMRKDMIGRLAEEIGKLQTAMSVLSPERATDTESRVAKLEERFADLAAAVFQMQNDAKRALDTLLTIPPPKSVPGKSVPQTYNVAEERDVNSVSFGEPLGANQSASLDDKYSAWTNVTVEIAPSELDLLRAQAEALGITVDRRWNAVTLRARIADASNREAA